MRVGVLLSGGVDSAVLVARYLKAGAWVQPIYVRAGLRWEGVERYWAKRYLAALGSPRLAPLATLKLDARDLLPEGHWSHSGKVPGRRADWGSVYLPGRNLLLLSKAAVLCAQRGIHLAAMGTLKGNPFPDARPEFFGAIAKAASLALGKPLRVETPFLRKSKEDILRAFPDLPYELTFSCIRPVGRRPCGRCTKCFERERAFARARRRRGT